MYPARMNAGEDGKLMVGGPLARRVLEQAAEKVRASRAATGAPPTLATILVGSNPASATYAKMKRKRAEDVGMRSLTIELPGDIDTQRLVAEIHKLANDPAVHGIVLQHPIPPPIDKRQAFETIPVRKDVDGVTSASLGRISLGMDAFAACTPRGIMRLLEEYRVVLDGVHAVVIGRSPILGKPMASLLINAHATVTLCHSHTRDLSSIVRLADVLIVAVGKPRFVPGGWIKPGCVVVDAGYSAGNVGDVDFDSAVRVASLITPVPGGVGPVTIATLIDQTADAAAQQRA